MPPTMPIGSRRVLGGESPQIRILYCVAVVVMVPSCVSGGWDLRRLDRLGHLRRAAADDSRVPHDALRERYRDHRDDYHEEGYDVHDGELLAAFDVVEDEDRERLLCPGSEPRHD